MYTEGSKRTSCVYSSIKKEKRTKPFLLLCNENIVVGKEEVHTGFWWGKLEERDHLEGPGMEGKITFKWIFEIGTRNMSWIYLAQDRDRRRAVVNAMMKLRVP
jgi:hypothetical protein